MRNTLAAAFALCLVACGGAATNEEAKSAADEALWKDFKGTYSEPAAPRAPKADVASKETTKEKAEPAAKAKAEPAPTEEALPAAPAAKKASKGQVKGESLSSVSVDQLTDASTTATKSKLVSSGTVTGKAYETISVQTKKVTIKITRPAASPNPSGPDVASPKAKSADVAKTDASWYDEDADVLVTVSAPKKATAQKALNAIVKR